MEGVGEDTVYSFDSGYYLSLNGFGHVDSLFRVRDYPLRDSRSIQETWTIHVLQSRPLCPPTGQTKGLDSRMIHEIVSNIMTQEWHRDILFYSPSNISVFESKSQPW